MQENRPIVLDSGSGYIKLGWAGETFPSLSYPAIVGRPMLRYDQKIEGVELKSIMVGDEAAPLRSMLELSYPTSEGIVTNWQDVELVWKYGFNKMKINPKESRILMAEAPLNPIKNREKMCELLFETFGFEKVQIGMQALLSLFAEGLMSGLLFDAGDGVSHCIPVSEGYILQNQIQRMNLAGRHVTDHLIKLLFLRGYAFNSTADFEVVREIKEKFCFVSPDIDIDRKLCKETTALLEHYRLPDGTLIKIERERFEAPEILFNPANAGYNFPGCAEMIFDCINKCPIDTRKNLYQFIVLSGGSTMFPGFPTRLQNEIQTTYKRIIRKGDTESEIPIEISVVVWLIYTQPHNQCLCLTEKDSPRRKYNVFIGAGVYASVMDKQDNWWLHKAEWDECGPRILKRIGETLSM